MEITNQNLKLELEILNKKFDEMSTKFDEMSTKFDEMGKDLNKKKPKQEETSTNWSITDYKNSVLISFSFNKEFKDYIKELGGIWMVSKKSWMFSKSEETKILEQIKIKFPKWEKI